MREYINEEFEQGNTHVQKKKAWKAYEQDFGCEFCWDAKAKKPIEIYFFDKANNMRLSNYCPNCGRTL